MANWLADVGAAGPSVRQVGADLYNIARQDREDRLAETKAATEAKYKEALMNKYDATEKRLAEKQQADIGYLNVQKDKMEEERRKIKLENDRQATLAQKEDVDVVLRDYHPSEADMIKNLMKQSGVMGDDNTITKGERKQFTEKILLNPSIQLKLSDTRLNAARSEYMAATQELAAAKTPQQMKTAKEKQDMAAQKVNDAIAVNQKAQENLANLLKGIEGLTTEEAERFKLTGDPAILRNRNAVKAAKDPLGISTTAGPQGVEDWADGIVRGDFKLSQVPARGQLRTQVVSKIKEKYPNAEIAKIEANKKFTESAGAANTLALVEATKNIITDMETEFNKLGRSGIPLISAGQDVWQKITGNEDRQKFISLKNYGVQEVERMLTGSGQMSDHRIKLAFETLSNASTPGQFKAAVEGLNKVVLERERSVRQGPYPEAKAASSHQASKLPSNLKAGW